MKLLPNFSSIPFDYLLISRVTNYAHNRRFLTFFIELIINRKLHAMKTLDLKFWLAFILTFSTNYLIESLLMCVCSFECLGFLKRLLMP